MKRGLVLILVIALGAALWATIAWVLFGPEEPDVEVTSTTEPARAQPLPAMQTPAPSTDTRVDSPTR